MPYGNGMRHSAPDELRSTGDCYLTEGWVVAHWLRQTIYRPPPDLLIWDPAACGVNGWAIGRALGMAWGRPYLLGDIRPMGPGVAQSTYPAPRPEHRGPVLTATNPPFKNLSQWIDNWRATAQHGDALLFVGDSGALTTAEPRSYGIVERVQPCKRCAFGLTTEDADRFRALVEAGEKAPAPAAKHRTGPTGEGMASTGKPHCIALWVAPAVWASGHREVCEEVTPGDLRSGLDLMAWCRESVEG